MQAARRGDSVVAMKDQETICIVVNSSDKVHRIDDHVIMVTAGLAGDGRMLASTVRLQCQQFRQATGEAPSTKEVAQMAASLQHELTRTPGARPLGCTAILAGVDNCSDLKLFQTDSGGILEECLYCAAGKGQEKCISSLDVLSNDLKKETDFVQMIRGMATVSLEAIQDENENEQHQFAHVWIIHGDETRRGGIHVRCIQKVTRKDLPRLAESLLEATKAKS
jgi:20S proteasome alpha/beta subunit